jgi:hypothetical protein
VKKVYKVQEKLIYTGWTFVEAASEDEAIKKFENDEGYFNENTAETYHTSTSWDTLQEVKRHAPPQPPDVV